MEERHSMEELLSELCECGHPVHFHHSESGRCLGALRMNLRGEMSNNCKCGA